jgi:hypothetical protein
MRDSKAMADRYLTPATSEAWGALTWPTAHWKPPSASWSYEAPSFVHLVDEAAVLAQPRDDERLLLKLRLALRAPQIQLRTTAEVLDRLAVWGRELLVDIRAQQRPYKELVPEVTSEVLSDYDLREIPDDLAAIQHRAFHYIGSARQGLHIGLVHRAEEEHRLPSYLLTFSSFDIPHAEPFVSRILGETRVVMLARVHGFHGAPRNAFSFAFSRSTSQLKAAFPDVDVVLTYVNPNVGFMGASYRAANWLPFAEEPAMYLYAGTRYVTAREVMQRGAVPPLSGPKLDGEQIRLSQQALMPLRLFAYPLSSRARRQLSREAMHGAQL